MPTILSTCSIVTGHASTQAPQVRQSQTASYGIAVSTSGRAIATGESESSSPKVDRTDGELGISGRPASASTASWRMPMMNVLGLSTLPVCHAGHACWQRPHSVQVKPSSRSFHERSATVRTPNVASSASRSIAGSWPRGATLRSAMLGIAVAMWRCLLNGR